MDLGYFEVGLDVQDIGRSVAFYETLGFEKVDGGVDIRNVSIQKGHCRIGLYQGHLDPAELQLIFWQGDVADIARDLERQGVTFFRGPDRDENGASFMLKDPDGHPIFVISLPVFHFRHADHARPADTTPRTARGVGPKFGWFIVSLAVVDLERSLAFYRKLGFELYSRQEGVATLRNADCTISLYQGLIEPDRSQLAFWQGDVFEIAGDLSAKGLEFARGPAKDDVGEGAILKDPDGLTIHFINVARLRRAAPA